MAVLCKYPVCNLIKPVLGVLLRYLKSSLGAEGSNRAQRFTHGEREFSTVLFLNFSIQYFQKKKALKTTDQKNFNVFQMESDSIYWSGC